MKSKVKGESTSPFRNKEPAEEEWYQCGKCGHFVAKRNIKSHNDQ